MLTLLVNVCNNKNLIRANSTSSRQMWLRWLTILIVFQLLITFVFVVSAGWTLNDRHKNCDSNQSICFFDSYIRTSLMMNVYDGRRLEMCGCRNWNNLLWFELWWNTINLLTNFDWISFYNFCPSVTHLFFHKSKNITIRKVYFFILHLIRKYLLI